MSGAILCFDLSKSCWNCDDPLPREPVEDRYCSTACWDDARERHEDERARTACCAECGYDRQEHNPACSSATARDRARAGLEVVQWLTTSGTIPGAR